MVDRAALVSAINRPSKPQPALGEIQEGTLALQVGGGVIRCN